MTYRPPRSPTLFTQLPGEPKSIVGEQSPVESRSRASSAYTALINIFFISLLGTIRTSGLGFLPLILATVGLANTLGLGVNLWRASPRRRSALSSGVGLWFGSTVVYALELWTRSTRRIGRATTRSSNGLFTYLPKVGILGSRGTVYSLPVYRARDIADNRTPDGPPSIVNPVRRSSAHSLGHQGWSAHPPNWVSLLLLCCC
jgi:hypothetical protein